MRLLALMATTSALTFAACSPSVDVSPAFDAIPKPVPASQIGVLNAQPFTAYKAALLPSFDRTQTFLIIYGEDVQSACFGLGNRMIEASVRQSPLIGRTTYDPKDPNYTARFIDQTVEPHRERLIQTGFVEILSLVDRKGTANVDIGTPGDTDHIRGTVEFTACL